MDARNDTVWIIVFAVVYAIATVFHLYLGGDMMLEMRNRKPERTLFTDSTDLYPRIPYRHCAGN